MSTQDLLKILRSRWITILVATIVTVLGSAAYTLTQTPLYQATTRLFVSNTSGATASELYNSSRYSQERVLSYTQLIMGETLAQRTIERLGLNMSPAAVKAKVTASSKPNTVLIDVAVLDPSPVQARDIANALSDEFVVMARDLETPSQGAKPDARVVVEQRASLPGAPVVPKKRRNLALGFVLGAMLGIGIAVLRDLLDNTVKSQAKLEELTGTGVVGLIPFDKKVHDSPPISFDSDNSGVAESFRKLRTNLQFLAVDNPPRMIVVTSTIPGEGKSTTAINIALALAEAQHNVVLVDGDLRRPRIATYLGVVASVGFSNLLSGAASMSEVLQPTKFPRMTVLAAGPTPPNPSELLGSLTAEKILNDLRAQFDYVIIDSPPLLAVTDGAILTAKSDGSLVAVRFGKTKRDQLSHAIGMLNDVGANLLGTVLTMVPVRAGNAYGYNYYSYSKKGYGDSLRTAPVSDSEKKTQPSGPGSKQSTSARVTASKPPGARPIDADEG